MALDYSATEAVPLCMDNTFGVYGVRLLSYDGIISVQGYDILFAKH